MAMRVAEAKSGLLPSSDIVLESGLAAIPEGGERRRETVRAQGPKRPAAGQDHNAHYGCANENPPGGLPATPPSPWLSPTSCGTASGRTAQARRCYSLMRMLRNCTSDGGLTHSRAATAMMLQLTAALDQPRQLRIFQRLAVEHHGRRSPAW